MVWNWKEDRGAAAVEFAFVLPLLVLLVLGGADIVMALMTANLMQWGVELGSYCYALKTASCVSVGPVQWVQLRTEMPTGGLSYDPGAACGVAGTWNYTFTPRFILPNIPITTSSCYPCHPLISPGNWAKTC